MLRFGLLGHTRWVRIWYKRGQDARLEEIAADIVALDAEPETGCLVNVGTVGLPFPGESPPSCAPYDRTSVEVLPFPAVRSE